MRTLKLQVQITVDGFVAGPEGQLDWMADFGKDEEGVTNTLTTHAAHDDGVGPLRQWHRGQHL